jgi:hypothetical protein
MSRGVNRLGWGSPGNSGTLTPANSVELFRQWVPAGAFVEDAANDQNFTRGGFGVLGSGTRENYWVYPFPDKFWSGGNPQYIYFDTVPPKNWTSEKLKFIVHFYQTDEVTPPGQVTWYIDAIAKQDNDALGSGTKQRAQVTYSLTTTDDTRKWITAQTNEITLSGATDADNVLLQLTRFQENTSSEESGEAYLIGLHILWSNA